jgi:hypothetical protein
MRGAVLAHPLARSMHCSLRWLTGNEEWGTMGKAKVKILNFAKEARTKKAIKNGLF